MMEIQKDPMEIRIEYDSETGKVQVIPEVAQVQSGAPVLWKVNQGAAEIRFLGECPIVLLATPTTPAKAAAGLPGEAQYAVVVRVDPERTGSSMAVLIIYP